MTNINCIEVRLGVLDVTRSMDFYCNTLGFAVTTLWPDAEAQFAILSLGHARLQLGRIEDNEYSEQRPACTLWMDVASVFDVYHRIKDKVEIEWGPEVYFYGRREFAFKDPDGYLVILSEATDEKPTS